MRWARIVFIQVIAVSIAAVIALLENILTNGNHPNHALVYGLVALLVLTVAGQSVGHIQAVKKDEQSARQISNIEVNAQKILDNQQSAISEAEEREVDQALARFPYVTRSFIKTQWKESPQEVRRIIDSVSEPTTAPTAVLTEWQQSLPEWLNDSNWHAITVAAELAQGYGVNRLAADLFLRAAPNSTRTRYWIARSALLTYIHENKQAAVRVLAENDVDLQSADTLARIVFCLVTGDRDSGLAFLRQWQPEEPIDIFLAGLIHVNVLANAEDLQGALSGEAYTKAVRVYRQLIAKLPQSSGARLGLAGSLIGVVSEGLSTDRHRDLNEALEQAIMARDIAREVRANSTQAVEMACQAAYEDMQFRRTIRIGAILTGEATPEEADSDIVRTYVATAALLLGEKDTADRLILEINDPFRKSTLVALSAEVDGKPSENLWNTALQDARDSNERAKALLGLARMGVAKSDEVESLGSELPKEAALIRAVSEAAGGNLTSAIQQLRTLQGSDINTVAALTSVYLQAGNSSAAADTLREGARVFNEPRLRVEAARLLSENGHHSDAVAELETLLVDSAGNKAVQHDCLGILGEWAAERNDWATAQLRFRGVLALDPSDDKARWALILAVLQQGFIPEARRVYDEAPSTPEITLPAQARAWMVTRSREDRMDAASFVNEVIDLAQRFPDDEDVQAQAIFTVVSPDNRDSDPLPPATQARFDRLFYHFVETWPQSSRLRTFSSNDAQALASQMDELVRPTQAEKRLRTEIADQLARNVMPWGALSIITARSYSEIVITRAGGVLPAQARDNQETQMCRTAAKAAINKAVVLDISAIGALIEIPQLSELLMSQFERLMISEQERLDAVKAEFHLRARATETWVYDEQSDRGRIVSISEDMANERYNKSNELLRLVARCRIGPVRPNERTSSIGKLAQSSMVTTIECAAQSEAFLWCDDVALRATARSIGTSAFSTPALVDVLMEANVLTSEQGERVTRTFIETLIGDFPLDPVRLSVLVAKHDGAATPVSSVFSRAAAWINFTYAYETWSTLVQQSARVNRGNASDWLYSAILGVARPQPNDRQCKEAAAIILSGAIAYIADDPVQVSRCVFAARAALISLDRDVKQVDPLARAVVILRASLAELAGIVDATSYVSRAFSGLQPEDRQTVLEALYVQ